MTKVEEKNSQSDDKKDSDKEFDEKSDKDSDAGSGAGSNMVESVMVTRSFNEYEWAWEISLNVGVIVIWAEPHKVDCHLHGSMLGYHLAWRLMSDKSRSSAYLTYP